MKWESVKLIDCCSKIGSGSTPRGGSQVYIDEGISLIRSQNVYNLRFEYEGLAYITENAAQKLAGVTVEPNDILLNITGDSVARTCLVPDNTLPARVNQHVAIIRPFSHVLNAKFLSYYLASPYMQKVMLGLAVGKGASRNAITKEMIERFVIPFPPVHAQEQIVDVLSSYDDFIENNRRQIKLLEQAAQRLYKEWFIDLHFPGWDTKSIVDGLPEGWRKGVLSETLDVLYGREHKNIPDGDIPVYGSGGLMRRCSQSLYQGESILIPRKGSLNNLMYVNEAFWTVDTMFYTRISLNDGAIYLYFCLRRFDFYAMDIGAAVPSMTSSILNSIEVSIPSPEVLDGFDSVVAPIFAQIHNLDEQINKLSEIRDRLLPKLMSGELEIENDLS